MSDNVQPGVKIDPALWEEFRNDIDERYDGVRGHLRTELENAIRQYLRTNGSATNEIIDQRLRRIEAAVGAAPTDGGTDTFDSGEHTHAPSRIDVDEKPAANAATEKKVAWLADELRDGVGGEVQEVTHDRIVSLVKDRYGFRADTAKRYVQHLRDYFELQEHPANGDILVTPERHEELMQKRRDDIRDEAEEQL